MAWPDPDDPHKFIRRVDRVFGELSDKGGWWHTLTCKHTLWSVDRKPKKAEVHCECCQRDAVLMERKARDMEALLEFERSK